MTTLTTDNEFIYSSYLIRQINAPTHLLFFNYLLFYHQRNHYILSDLVTNELSTKSVKSRTYVFV